MIEEFLIKLYDENEVQRFITAIVRYPKCASRKYQGHIISPVEGRQNFVLSTYSRALMMLGIQN